MQPEILQIPLHTPVIVAPYLAFLVKPLLKTINFIRKFMIFGENILTDLTVCV